MSNTPVTAPPTTAAFARRTFLKTTATALTGVAAAVTATKAFAREQYVAHGRNIRQSVAPWCFRPMPLDELAANAAKMGVQAIELIGPDQFGTIKKHGLTCAMISSHGFAKGFAQKDQHEECLKVLRERIDAAAANKYSNVITFSGFRKGVSDEEGMANMVDGLKRIVGYAEDKQVTLCLEMLNSKVNVEMKGHPDYFCDDIDRTVEVCRKVGSERLKVLFDIYHVQIMHGDVISRLKSNMPFIGHIHTAGNPGRGEIDTTQEINYAAVMRAVANSGYKGFVGQEFIPVRDKMASLSEAVRICDV